MSVARDSFTRRMRPRRSAASGVRIWVRMLARWSAGAEGVSQAGSAKRVGEAQGWGEREEWCAVVVQVLGSRMGSGTDGEAQACVCVSITGE